MFLCLIGAIVLSATTTLFAQADPPHQPWWSRFGTVDALMRCDVVEAMGAYMRVRMQSATGAPVEAADIRP